MASAEKSSRSKGSKQPSDPQPLDAALTESDAFDIIARLKQSPAHALSLELDAHVAALESIGTPGSAAQATVLMRAETALDYACTFMRALRRSSAATLPPPHPQPSTSHTVQGTLQQLNDVQRWCHEAAQRDGGTVPVSRLLVTLNSLAIMIRFALDDEPPPGESSHQPSYRPVTSDVKRDAQISAAWKTGQYTKKADLADEFNMPLREVRAALDRHRKR